MKTISLLLASLATLAAAQDFGGGGSAPGGMGSDGNMAGSMMPDDFDTGDIRNGGGGVPSPLDDFIESDDTDLPPMLAPRDALPPLPANAIDASLMISRDQPRHVYAGGAVTLEYSVSTPWALDLARADVVAHLSFGFGPRRVIAIDDILKVSAVAAGSNHTGPPPLNSITIDIPYAVCMRENPAKVVNVTLLPLGVQQPTPGQSAPIKITCFNGLGQRQWMPAMTNYFAACLPPAGGEAGAGPLPDVTSDMPADDFAPPPSGIDFDTSNIPPPSDDVPQASMPPGGSEDVPPPPMDDSIAGLPSASPMPQPDASMPPMPPTDSDTMQGPPPDNFTMQGPPPDNFTMPMPSPLPGDGAGLSPSRMLRRSLQQAGEPQCPALGGACNPTYCRPRPRCVACNGAVDAGACCASLASLRSATGLPGCIFEEDACRTALPRRIDLQLLREQMDGEGRIDAGDLLGEDGRVSLDLSAATGSFRLQLGNDRANATLGGMAPPMEMGSIRIGCDGCNGTMRQVVQVDGPVRFNEETRVRPGGELLLGSDVELSQDLQVDAGASIELRGSLSGDGAQRARVAGDARIAPGTSLSGVSFEVEAGGVARMQDEDTVLRLRQGANFTVASSATLELTGARSRIEASADAGMFTNAGRLVVRGNSNATLDAAGRPAPRPPVARINSTVINNGEMDVESGELILEGGVRNAGRLSVRAGGSMQLGGNSTFERQAGGEAGQQVQVEGVLRLQPGAIATFRAPVNSTGRIFAGRESVVALDSDAAGTDSAPTRSILARPMRPAAGMTAAQEVVAQRGDSLSPRQADSLESQFSSMLGAGSAAAQDLSSAEALEAALEMLRSLRVRHLSMPFRLREHRVGAPVANASQTAVLAELADRMAQVKQALEVGGLVRSIVADGPADDSQAQSPRFNAVAQAFLNPNVSAAIQMGAQLGAGVVGEEPAKTHQLLAAVAIFASGGHLPMSRALQMRPAQLLDLAPLAKALAFPKRGPMLPLVKAVHHNETGAPGKLLQHVRRELSRAGLDTAAAGLPAAANAHDAMLLAADTIALLQAARRQDAALDCAGSLEVAGSSAVTLSADGIVEGVLRLAAGSSMEVVPQQGQLVTLEAVDAQVSGQLDVQGDAALDVHDLSVDDNGLLNLAEGGNMTLLEPATGEILFGVIPTAGAATDDQQQQQQPPPPPASQMLRRVLRGPVAEQPAKRRATTTSGVLMCSGKLDGSGPMSAGSMVVTGTGTVAPGSDDAAGQMQVNGDVNFQAGSRLLLDVMSPAHFDRLDVTGTLTLGGRVEVMGAAAPQAPPLTAAAIETTETFEVVSQTHFELGHDDSGKSVGSDGETGGPDEGAPEPKEFPLVVVVAVVAAVAVVVVGLLVYFCCCRRNKSPVSSKYVSRQQEPELMGAAAIGHQ